MDAKKSSLGLVVAGLLLGILMSSMDNTIVTTAMGTIIAELGGLDKFVWVTSAYMAAEMAGMPIFGKLSDMYGRKRFFIFGLIVFLAGSILCGTAQSIIQLSIYRAIQGIGGGALIPIAFTIMFDIFPPEKRGGMGGLFGATFGLSSIFGPLLGAYITDYIGWHWVFYINLPLGIAALVLISLFYHESHEHSKQRIDWLGAVTLIGAVVSLMFALELGGQKYAWSSGVIIGLFAAFAVLLLLFLYIETRAEEPIISYSMFRKRLYAASNLVAIFSGGTFIVVTVYIPIFVQGVMGGSATNSGLILLPMMLGSVVSAQLGGFASTRTSYRSIMIVFSFIFLAGIILLATLTTDTSRLAITLIMIVTGLGIGASFSVLGMSAIHHFDARQRGSANSTIGFLRELGMTIGITVFGVIQRTAFSDRLSSAFGGSGQPPQGFNFTDPHAMLSPQTRVQIPAQVLDKITAALSTSIAHTFLWAVIPAVFGIISVFLMSGERMAVFSKTGKPALERE